MFVNHLKRVFLSAIHKKSSQMLKLIDWFCFCNTDFRTCFKFIASHFKTESCLQLCCITSSFSSNLFNELERQRRPTLVAFIATCFNYLAWCQISAPQKCVVSFIVFFVSQCTNFFQWVTDLNCRPSHTDSQPRPLWSKTSLDSLNLFSYIMQWW